MRKFLVAIPIAVHRRRWLDGVCHEEIRQDQRRGSERQGRSVGKSLEETQERTGGTRAASPKSTPRPPRRRRRPRRRRVPPLRQAARTARPTGRNGGGQRGQRRGWKAEAVDKATKRLVYEVVLSEDEGNFKFGKTDLPDEAKAKLDQMVTALKADPKGAYFEIEGHTDNVGDPKTNERIGLERAESVKRYLYEQHQIPLHKMNVISYGEEKPIAPNKTRDGRAQNRRVVIKVLA